MVSFVQSVRFDRRHWKLADAKKWLIEKGYLTSFRGKGVDTTIHQFRFRQTDPSTKNGRYKVGTLRLPNHVQLIIYYGY